MIKRLYRPELFQGNLRKKKYFEGWYFKHVSQDLSQVYSFIPGVSLSTSHAHSFIQVINGISGKTDYVEYSLDEFTWDKNRLSLKVGKSSFTENYVDINITGNNLDITGHIDYDNIVKYPKSLFSPGIMGWYSFIPFMECKHGIVSSNHNLKGHISVNGDMLDFNNGKGYIEKDWGASFPEAWIWVQCNNFNDSATSFSFSIAKIPWLGKFFIGFIAFLYYDKQYILFSTYNWSSVSEIKQEGNDLCIVIGNKNYTLRIKVVKNSFGELRAPLTGVMSRRIKESIDSVVYLSLYNKENKLIYEDSGKRAGLEIIDTIFKYLK